MRLDAEARLPLVRPPLGLAASPVDVGVQLASVTRLGAPCSRGR
jgi:hypothetical protein